MSALLEVIACHRADAERAADGGADRVEVVGSMTDGGMSPEPQVVAEIRRATTIQVRVMLRLRPGFSTDGGEVTRLKGLASTYVDLGADGIVMGFLNGHSQVDVEVCSEICSDGDWPWTFHRALDQTFDTDKAWHTLATLPRLDQVLTAGSARTVDEGLDDLLRLARSDPWIAKRMMAGGGLKPEHVPWLVRAGVRSFHIGSSARPLGSYKAYVDPGLVGSWRSLLDAETRHPPGSTT